MFIFVEKAFSAITAFFNLSYVNSLKCDSMSNYECKARPKIIDVNNNELVFYPYSIKVNKCSGSCSNINNPYAELCIPDIIKKINVKVVNLMTRINETRQILWHETCKCVCKLSVAVCNSKQIWNDDKCRCECKEDFIDKMARNKGFSWNPSDCSCECKKTLIDKLVEEGTSVIDENKVYNET